MDQVFKFLHLLKKYRLILIIVPIITVIITFFLVRNLPSSYISQAQVATGIVDETQQQSVILQSADRDKVNQKFSNLMEIMRMNKVLDQVSYQLIIHDLTAKVPFKNNSKELLDLNQSVRAQALMIFREKYLKRQGLTLTSSAQNDLFELLKSMGYDAESLKKKLLIYRPGDSDFIVLQFESENPDLSAMVVNSIASEFIKNYTSSIKESQVRASNFFSEMLREKSDTLSNRMKELRNYKVKNGVLNLTEQSKQLYTLILQYDTKKQEAIEKTSSYAGAVNEIDKKFDPRDRNYIEASLSKLNQSIVNTKEELSTLYDLYITNDLDPKYKSSYDSLSKKLTAQVNRSSDQYITNPLNTKQELISQKLNLEIQLDISRYSINSIANKLKTLNKQFEMLVPKEADVQSLEMSIDIASKEYLDILNKYNQSNLESSFSTKMIVAQPGVPGLSQPSKKMLLVILSGIISFVFCLLVIFIIYFLDESISSAQELANATDIPVLGEINQLSTASQDLNHLWNQETQAPHLLDFKNQLRSLRFEIERDLKDKVLVITSIHPSEGKTLIALSLALAWKMTNKKILVIDGNFSNPGITKAATSKIYLEDFFNNQVDLDKNNKSGSIDILGNKGGDTSLLELASHEQIQLKIEEAKNVYDLIIIETAALTNRDQSKEWALFSKNILSVFESGGTITQSKKNYIAYLKETGSFMGWIINKVNSKTN
ncbi:succinoglycan biosynthesis transport protein ExoP [Pedobacter sp. CG_S7]|uniref:exopolysaccharide transport family protein n=1 Tax=Pedobacter sp. CG_S7 TaxID=3143930 RepID=UPI00339ADC9A